MKIKSKNSYQINPPVHSHTIFSEKSKLKAPPPMASPSSNSKTLFEIEYPSF